MSKQPRKSFRMAPLQRLTVKPIEDPAEQAALDERLKRCEEAGSVVANPESGSPPVQAKRRKSGSRKQPTKRG
jgi:hypothetical protein